jgi:hypothetical protein
MRKGNVKQEFHYLANWIVFIQNITQWSAFHAVHMKLKVPEEHRISTE